MTMSDYSREQPLILCDELEAYSRHTGHIGLLREAVDGRVSADSPAVCQPGGCA
jgi:hypothetical protein